MNCWEILGIEPTGDHQRVREAYERQLKFASGNEVAELDRAFREATGDTPPEADRSGETAQPVVSSVAEPEADDRDRPLAGHEAQVVREVVIQVKALLNDSRRSQDEGVWKAILCEPPADQDALRREIARQLAPQLRPMAENGSFPAPVTHFLGNWFEWQGVATLADELEQSARSEEEAAEPEQELPPQAVNFWPAVIGWIVGLAILASLFGGMGGG